MAHAVGWGCWFTSAEKREDYYEDPDSFVMSAATSGVGSATAQTYSRSRWDETDLLADHVESFIKDNADRKWLAYVAPTAPHDPCHPAMSHYLYPLSRALLIFPPLAGRHGCLIR